MWNTIYRNIFLLFTQLSNYSTKELWMKSNRFIYLDYFTDIQNFIVTDTNYSVCLLTHCSKCGWHDSAPTDQHGAVWLWLRPLDQQSRRSHCPSPTAVISTPCCSFSLTHQFIYPWILTIFTLVFFLTFVFDRTNFTCSTDRLFSSLSSLSMLETNTFHCFFK